jgi:hypothetical protein
MEGIAFKEDFEVILVQSFLGKNRWDYLKGFYPLFPKALGSSLKKIVKIFYISDFLIEKIN